MGKKKEKIVNVNIKVPVSERKAWHIFARTHGQSLTAIVRKLLGAAGAR